MTHLHDLLRKRLLADIITEPPRKLRTQWSPEFERAMRARLLVGAFRYGDIHNPFKPRFDNIQSALDRLRLYKLDGNQEHLVDAANLCLIEFVHPNHPSPHFSPSDDSTHAKELK